MSTTIVLPLKYLHAANNSVIIMYMPQFKDVRQHTKSGIFKNTGNLLLFREKTVEL